MNLEEIFKISGKLERDIELSKFSKKILGDKINMTHLIRSLIVNSKSPAEAGIAISTLQELKVDNPVPMSFYPMLSLIVRSFKSTEFRVTPQRLNGQRPTIAYSSYSICEIGNSGTISFTVTSSKFHLSIDKGSEELKRLFDRLYMGIKDFSYFTIDKSKSKERNKIFMLKSIAKRSEIDVESIPDKPLDVEYKLRQLKASKVAVLDSMASKDLIQHHDKMTELVTKLSEKIVECEISIAIESARKSKADYDLAIIEKSAKASKKFSKLVDDITLLL